MGDRTNGINSLPSPENLIKVLKGKIPESEIEILVKLLERVKEEGPIKWNQLNGKEKFALAGLIDQPQDITLETFAKILHSTRDESTQKFSRGKNTPSFPLPGKEKEDISFSPIPKGKIGEEGKSKGKIGEEFYFTLLKAIMSSDLTNKPYDAIPIAVLHLSNKPMTRSELDKKVNELHDLLKGPRLKEVLGGKKEEYSPKSLGNAIDSVVNNTYIVKREEERKIQYYSLLPEIRDKIFKTLEEIWEQEMAKAELEAQSITERETTIKAFVNFFRHYVDDDGKKVYLEAIKDILVKDPRRSLEIDFTHLNAFHPELAEALLEWPEDVISPAEDAIQIILMEDLSIEEPFKIHARFYNLPKTLEPRFVGPEYINKFIQVRGIITRLSSIEPFVSRAVYLCKDCGHEMVRLQKPYSVKLRKPTKCENCGSRNIELDPDKSTFLRYQSSIIQDQPERLKGGQMPRQLHMVFLEDLCDTVIPGDRVTVTGILRMVEEARDTRPVRRIVFIANHVEKESKDVEDIKITPEEEQRILKEVKSPDFKEKLIRSFAPTVYGYRNEKFGILLSLFGGEDEHSPTGEPKRRRIHVLLIGDPSTAKSHLLGFASQIAPRAVEASGTGATGVGLTAAANRDELTGKWTVDAGTLVLADQGFAIIDELDKMNKNDRDHFHVPMEQGKIAIAKAGINMVLNARATIIAAANPRLGIFNRMKTPFEQIDLPPTLFSRFDLLFIFLDEPNPKHDEQVAEAILERWYKPEEVQPPYSPEFLQKIIAYARKKIKTLKITPEAYEELKNFYVKVRKRVKAVDKNVPIPITARQLEAMIRLAEACARMRLSDVVTKEDAEEAKKLIEYTLRKVAMDEEGNLDVSIIEVGKSSRKINKEATILDIIKELQDLEDWGAPRDDIIKEAARQGMSMTEAKAILERLLDEKRVYMPKGGYYKVM